MARFVKAEIVEALISAFNHAALSVHQERMVNHAKAALEKPDFGPLPPDGVLQIIGSEWEDRRKQGYDFCAVAKPILMAWYLGAEKV